MGYQTDFRGELEFSEKLDSEQKAQIHEFSEQRHGGNMNHFPGMPGFWCNWDANEEGTALSWNGAEKFYDYVEWLQYLIDNFFNPWGIKLNGEIDWRGEEWDDQGTIKVTDSKVEVSNG